MGEDPGTRPHEPEAGEPPALQLPVESESPAVQDPGPGTARRRAVPILAVACYALLALGLYWPVSPLSSTRILACGCSDPALDTWFIAWTPHVITHHLDPLFTTSIEFPYGINLAVNTWMPLLGLIGAPVTLTLGPVATVNLLFRLAFVCSAAAMYLALRRIGATQRAAFVGGLLYGFSPYMIGQGSFHLNLVFVPLPPLILLSWYRLVSGRARSPVRAGCAIGALAALQYYVSSEVVADVALLALISAVAAAVVVPGAARREGTRVAAGVLVACSVFVLLCGYVVAYQFVGRQHLGLNHPFGNLENFNSDLLAAIVPTRHQLLAPAALAAHGSSFTGGNLPENGGYLGVGLLAVLTGMAIVRRRVALVRWSLLLAAVAYAFSLGRRLIVDNHVTGFWMPFQVLWRLPLFSSELPARYSLLVALFAAVALAVGLDPPAASGFPAPTATGVAAEVVRSSADPAPSPRRADRIEPTDRVDSLRFWAIAAVALAPLVPVFGYRQPATEAPTAFLASATARSIPAGSVVLTYPYTAPPHDDALLWQAQAGFPFSLIGGYGVTPNPGDVDYPQIPPPTTMWQLFEAAWAPRRTQLPPESTATITQLRAFCLFWQVSTIVVDPLRGRWRLLERYLEAAFGPARWVGGVLVWTGVQVRARTAVPQLRAGRDSRAAH